MRLRLGQKQKIAVRVIILIKIHRTGFEPVLLTESDLESDALTTPPTMLMVLQPGIEPGSLSETDPMDYHFPSVAWCHLKSDPTT